MDKAADEELVSDLAREVLVDLAPHELEIFPLVCEAFFRDPSAPLRAQGRRDDILGSGLEPGAVFFTPVVLLVLGEVVRFLSEQLRKALAEESTTVIRAVLRRLFRWRRKGEPASGAEPPLPTDFVRRVHEIVHARASQLLPEREAQLLAELVAGALVVDPPARGGS